MNNKLNAFKKLLIQPLTCSICKLVARVITASNSRKSKLRMHCKQHLNSFWEIDKFLKKLTNDKLENNKVVSMRNNLNVGPVIDDVHKTGLTRHMWEVNNHGEKGM